MTQKKNKYDIMLYFPVLFLLIVSFTKMANFDFFWHLAAGRHILRNLEILRSDIFSLSREGAEWFNYHIIFQILAYSFYSLFGFAGFSIYKSLLIIFAWGLLFRKKLKSISVADSILMLFFITLLSYRLMLRPEQLTIIYLVLTLQLITSKISLLKKSFGIIFLQLLWNFSHSAFLILPVILVIRIFSSILNKGQGKFSESFVLLIVSSVTLLINPFGVAGLEFAFNLMFKVLPGDDLFKNNIYEFKSFSFDLFDLRTYSFFAAFIYLIFLIRRKKLYEFCLLAVFISLGLSAVRNYSLFLFVFFLIVFEEDNRSCLSILYREEYKKVLSSIIAVISLIFSFQFVGGTLYTQQTITADFGSGVSEEVFSEELPEFLKTLCPGKIFNTMSLGGYLIFMNPELKVYYDGRLDLYGKEYFSHYGRMVTDYDYFREKINSENIELVILNYSIGEGYLLYEMLHDLEWKLIFFDYKAMVLGRSSLFEKQKEIKVKLNRDAGI